MNNFVIGDIRRTGQYSDGTPQFEIWFPIKKTGQLPIKHDFRVPMTLQIGQIKYKVGLRSTEKNKYAQICPDALTMTGERETLGRILTEAKFHPNDHVKLKVDGSLLTLINEKLGEVENLTSLPNWELVVEAIKALGGNANLSEIETFFLQNFSDKKIGNVRPSATGITVNEKSRIHFFQGKEIRRTDSGNKYDRLFLNNDNRYEFYDPSAHGVWEIARDGQDKLICRKFTNPVQQNFLENNLTMANSVPLNQILFGPPGTGKTFSTINKALEILDPKFSIEKRNERAILKSKFDELVETGRIVFCTFHQSFSYEDFVEGLRAISVDGQIEYRVESGVFKNICNSALDSAYENVTTGHFVSDDKVNDSLRNFIIQITEEPMRLQTKTGKFFTVSYKNGSKGFRCIPDASPTVKPMQPGIEQVRQMLNGIDPAYNAIYARSISEYIKKQFNLDGNFPDANTTEVRKIPYVLIIDEINRGNISKIFGELITLIEPSKRAGGDEALAVTLPYSKEIFSVPDNVYLIGTMNTADRSLANLDIALRRRFHFVSMSPKADLLMNIFVEDVNVGELLQTMNQRIEVLLGKEHCLGHAYFMPLAENSSLPLLADIFRRQIIPLLQEYFFEDWQRICWVLNDHRKVVENRFLTQSENNLAKLFGDEEGARLKDNRWKLQQSAFDRIDAYAGVIDHEKKIKSKLIAAANSSEIRREIEFNGLKISQLKDGGSIRIMGVADGAVKDTLRKQAVILGIDTLNGNGNECTTQELGAKIIKAFDAQKTMTRDMQE